MVMSAVLIAFVSETLSHSKISSNLSLAGTSSGKVTQTGTILVVPGPNVLVGLFISKVTLGNSVRFPNPYIPLRVKVSSPFPGFSSFRISLVLSDTLNTDSSGGDTISAFALKTCNTCSEIVRLKLFRLSAL